MGLLDRLDDAWEAAKKALLGDYGDWSQPAAVDQARMGAKHIVVDGVAGLGYDLFVQPYKDAQAADTSAHWYSFITESGQAIGKGLYEGALDVGAAAGGALEVATSPLASAGVDVPGALNTTYEFADRNLATAYLAANLADREGLFSPSIFQQKTWDDAADIRESHDLSFGQSFALARMDGDIRNAAEREKFMQGTFYDITSKTTDLIAPIALDPLALGAKGAINAKTRYITKPLKPTDKVDEIVASRRVQKVATEASQMDASSFALKHPELTGEQAWVLTEAAKTERSADLVLRSMMGDDVARNLLERYESVFAARAARLTGDKQALHAAGHFDNPRGQNFYNPVGPEAKAALEREIKHAENTADLTGRAAAQFNTIQDFTPRTGALKDLKYGIVRSDWYQNGKLATPVRMYYNMRPAGILVVDDPSSHIQIQRLMDHSALDEPTRAGFVSQYLASNDPQARAAVAEAAVNASIDSVLTRHGIHADDRARILEQAEKGRAHTNLTLSDRSYDGENRGWIEIVGDDGHVTKMPVPLWVTQDMNMLSLPDLTAVDKMAARYSPNRPLAKIDPDLARAVADKTTEAFRISEASLETMQGLWKASTLLRVAYPFRVVGEEQVRMMALFGAMAPLKYATSGARNIRNDRLLSRAEHRALIADYASKHDGQMPSSQRVDELWKEAKKAYKSQFRTRGFRDTQHLGVAYEPALGGQGRMFGDFLASRFGYDRTLGRDVISNEQMLRDMGKEHGKLYGTGAFEGGITYKMPDGSLNPSWKKAWYSAVTRQIAQDRVARLMLLGKTDEQILAWLKSNRDYSQKLHPQWREDPERWLTEARGQVDSYLPTPALRDAALKGHIDAKLVDREFETVPRPVVHGEILSQHLEGHPAVVALNNFTATMFKALASKPTEILSRNQAFNHSYVQRMNRSIELHIGRQQAKGDTVQISEADLARYQRLARNEALQVVKRNFYDLTTESDLAHALRFISPFFGAFQETIGVWSRLSLSNPSFVLRLHDVWEAPDRAGFTTTDPNGDERLLIPLPGKGFTIPGIGTIDNLNLSKKGLNTILNMPGVGPVATVPVSEIVKNRPDWQDNRVIELLYPYGVPQNVTDAVTPKTLRNGIAAFKAFTDPNFADRRYLTMWNGLYQTEYTKYRLGLRDEPSREEIDDRAAKMSLLRLLTDFVAPTQVKFDSPYQPFIDTYKRMLAEDASTADERFHEQFGDDYYQLTGTITANVAGIPATLEGWKQSEKYKQLLADNPEVAAAIIGQGAFAGEFNTAVYNQQIRTPFGGTGQNFRETMSRNEIMDAPKVELGWLEFRKFDNALKIELEARGLERITDKGAQDMREVRTNYIHNIMREKYPEWYEKFTVRDTGRSQKRADAFAKVAFDISMLDRTDMAGVREYIEARTAFLTELRARNAAGGSGALDAKSNADMAEAWEGFTSDLTRRNASFAPLFLRYFANDAIEVH